MSLQEILKQYDEHERFHSPALDIVRTETPYTVRYHVAPHRSGWITYENLSQLSPQAAEEIIKGEIDWFRGRCVNLEWKVFAHSSPSWLGELLQKQGFEAEDPDSIMVLPLKETPSSLSQPVQHDIRSKAPGEDMGDVLKILNGAFGGDHARHMAVLSEEHRTHPGHLSIYVGYVEDQPVCCGWIRFPPSPFASIWGGATLPEYRGRGLYQALLRIRVQEAMQRNYPYVYVDAGDMSRPIVERNGFRLLTTATSYVYPYELFGS
ncbi:MAG: GNAT family N-acetyltransferase [Anaerolineae bacterium]|nr:GNAT family N-acetyltransferase [Anaerolineae bacterium]